MIQQTNDPRLKQEYHQTPPGPADNNYGREGGDDSLSDIRPSDQRADEKVIVNTQESSHAVNRPSQSEIDSTYENVVNE